MRRSCHCDYTVYIQQIWVSRVLQTFYQFSAFSQQFEPNGVQLFHGCQLTAHNNFFTAHSSQQLFSQLTTVFSRLTAEPNTPYTPLLTVF